MKHRRLIKRRIWKKREDKKKKENIELNTVYA